MRSLFLQANFQQPGFLQWGFLPYSGGGTPTPPPPSGGFCGIFIGIGQPFPPTLAP